MDPSQLFMDGDALNPQWSIDEIPADATEEIEVLALSATEPEQLLELAELRCDVDSGSVSAEFRVGSRGMSTRPVDVVYSSGRWT